MSGRRSGAVAAVAAAALVLAPAPARGQSLPINQTRTVQRRALVVTGGAASAAGRATTTKRLIEMLNATYGFDVDWLDGTAATRETIMSRLQRAAYSSRFQDYIFVVLALPAINLSASSFVVPADGNRSQTWTLIRGEEMIFPFMKSAGQVSLMIMPSCRAPGFGQTAKGFDTSMLPPPYMSLLTFCGASGDAGDVAIQTLFDLLSRGAATVSSSVGPTDLAAAFDEAMPTASVELRTGFGSSDRLFAFDPLRDRFTADLAALSVATPAEISRVVQSALAAPSDRRGVAIERAAAAIGRVSANPSQAQESRSRAVQGLGELGAKSSLPSLAALVSRPDSPAALRKDVVDAAVHIGGPDAIGIVRTRLRDPDPAVRAAALRGVAALHDLASAPAVSSMLKGEREDDVRVAAVQALALLQARNEKGAIVNALRDPSVIVRREAANALGGLNVEVASELLSAIQRESDPSVQSALIYAVAHVPHAASVTPAIEVALTRAAGSDAAPVREAAVFSLGAFASDSARGIVRNALRDGNERVRGAAVLSAGRQRDRAAVPLLLPLLDSKQPDIRGAAVESLGRIGDRAAISPIVERLKDEDEYVRATAGRWLAVLQADSELEAALRDESPGVRRRAVETFVFSTAPVPVNALVSALGDVDFDVRLAAVRAFDRLTDEDLAPLIQGVSDREPRRQQASLVVVGNLAERPKPPDLAAVEAPLQEVLARPPNASVHAEAVRTAGKIGGRGWLAPILRAADAADPTVRRAAAEALGRFAGDDFGSASGALERLAQDPVLDVQQAAADSLRRLKVK